MALLHTATAGGRSIPAQAGIGLRAAHHEALTREPPRVGWLEAHSENYFGEGGAQLEALETLRALYPLSLHGVGLSLGSSDSLDHQHLRRLKRLVERVEPALVSEHLSWGSVQGRHSNDLLPLPYTDEALALMVERVQQLQEFLGRQVLIENVSSYLQYVDSQFSESEFVAELARRSGCAILLDVNNVYVNACNHQFDPRAFIDALPRGAVAELHLAGHSTIELDGRQLLLDTHSTPVCAQVWSLYEYTLGRFGPLPTLIEWDSDLPAPQVLLAEAARAEARLEKVRARAA